MKQDLEQLLHAALARLQGRELSRRSIPPWHARAHARCRPRRFRHQHRDAPRETRGPQARASWPQPIVRDAAGLARLLARRDRRRRLHQLLSRRRCAGRCRASRARRGRCVRPQRQRRQRTQGAASSSCRRTRPGRCMWATAGTARSAPASRTCSTANGYAVHREYYVNDAGRQMDIIAVSIWLRYLEALRRDSSAFPPTATRANTSARSRPTCCRRSTMRLLRARRRAVRQPAAR